METILEPRGEDADHALVPSLIKHCETVTISRVDMLQRGQCCLLHVGFDTAPLAVERVKF